MEDPNFSSLEEAWIDLCVHLSDPVFLELFGRDARSFFYAGATAALTLMASQRRSELERDLKQFTNEVLGR